MIEKEKATLVLGASLNPARYAHLAVRNLQASGHPVIAVGLRAGDINGVPVVTEIPEHTDIHTLTLYMNPRRQEPYYEEIIRLKPERIIFNPGTENPELVRLAQDAGIYTTFACTLVMLSVDTY